MAAAIEVGESGVRGRFTYVEEQIPLLDRLWNAQSRMERSYARAQRELERLQTPGATRSTIGPSKISPPKSPRRKLPRLNRPLRSRNPLRMPRASTPRPRHPKLVAK